MPWICFISIHICSATRSWVPSRRDYSFLPRVFLSSIFVCLASINYRAKLRATVVCNSPAIKTSYSEPPSYLTHPHQDNIFTGLTPSQVGTALMPRCPSQLFKPVNPKLFSWPCFPFHPETPVKAVVYASPSFLSASLGTLGLPRLALGGMHASWFLRNCNFKLFFQYIDFSMLSLSHLYKLRPRYKSIPPCTIPVDR